ncbi:hypothetical protein P171DRAFT_515628 [Karstenula rhodostoma CBS 690.94]|uniref:Uncharacterized protein n=1 Tax=Karstenula rhodostoma CBS 690.94 TaxID=1392251 RepID=A0A9P4PUK4_9PLEO|nr:hypothetical protein P171DRAFT_515628 [Karstenula rhodostoma CBS 690.94]
MGGSRIAANSTQQTMPKPTGLAGSRFAQPTVVAAPPTSAMERLQMPADVKPSTFSTSRCKFAESGSKESPFKAFKNAVIDNRADTTSNSLGTLNSATISVKSPCKTSTASKYDSYECCKDVFKASISGPISSSDPFAAATSTSGSKFNATENFMKHFEAHLRRKGLLDSKGNACIHSASTSSGDSSSRISMPLHASAPRGSLAIPNTTLHVEEDPMERLYASLDSKSNSSAPTTSTKSSEDSSNESSVPLATGVTVKSFVTGRPAAPTSNTFMIEQSKITSFNPVKPNQPPIASGNPFALADPSTWKNLMTTSKNPSAPSYDGNMASSLAYFDSNRVKPKPGNWQMEAEELSSASNIDSDFSTEVKVNHEAPVVSATTACTQMGISRWAPDHLKVQKPDKNTTQKATIKKT